MVVPRNLKDSATATVLFRMERRSPLGILLIISALFLMMAESESLNTSTAVQTAPPPSITSSCACACTSTSPAVPSSKPSTPAPVLGIFTVEWKDKSCKGRVLLSLRNSTSLPVCSDSQRYVQTFLHEACHITNQCDSTPTWEKGTETQQGYEITEDGVKEGRSCRALMVTCSERQQVSEFQGYKVATALLCILLLVIIAIRFTKPTLKAVQRRLSDRRQSRWVGPTQSHSVSYHRGKAALKENDGDKRLSYPALERLAISTSREPSSNRNRILLICCSSLSTTPGSPVRSGPRWQQTKQPGPLPVPAPARPSNSDTHMDSLSNTKSTAEVRGHLRLFML
ncbi:hypothetical protein LDENG_00104560 [Lucifuga dentata]|nr:hypothetical protein LDENG_00104560 [Lucifuga dentata]